MAIKRGDIARCSRGQLGLITASEPKWITYKRCYVCDPGRPHHVSCTCERGYAFVGVHLTSGEGHNIGDPWSSREPRIVAHIDSILPELS